MNKEYIRQRRRMMSKKQDNLLRGHLVLFLILLFGIVLLANLRWEDQTFWIGFQMENQLRQFQTMQPTLFGFVKYFLKYRLLLWIVLCIPGFMKHGKMIYLCFTGFLGCCLGFVLATSLQQFGILGILFALCLLLPHIPLLVLVYVLLVKNTVRDRRMYLVKCLLLSGIVVAAVACEYYVNPYLLKFFTCLIS